MLLNLRKLIVVGMGTSTLLFSSAPLMAESVTFEQIGNQQQIDTFTPQTTSLNEVSIGLDNDGNAMIRYGNLSLSLIYDVGSTLQKSRSQSRYADSRQEVATIGGMSVKFCIDF